MCQTCKLVKEYVERTIDRINNSGIAPWGHELKLSEDILSILQEAEEGAKVKVKAIKAYWERKS